MNTTKAPEGHFTILYFASASSYTKKASGGQDFFPAPIKASAIYDILEAKYPGIKSKVLNSCLLNIDEEYVDLEEETAKGEDGMTIQEGSIVVIIPPVSAG